MQITIDFKDENIAKNVLWFLESLKDKGVSIISSKELKNKQDADFKNLQISSMQKTWDNDLDRVWDEL